uniref:metal-binding protein ZinT n=1 Tax=Enterococcus sp. TaxID=35783 RepID=UPI00289FA1DD
ENAKDSIARTLASEAGVELAVLNPLEGLTQEQMDNGENYISIMEQNRDALRKTTDVANDKEITETEKEKTVYNGYFEDHAVEDRPLSAWAGEWQSVYPFLEDGTLDQVFDYKAKQTQKMTAEEYKAYYTTGYQTDVASINITDQTMTFIFDDGTEKEATYTYAGKEILTYEAGNRGVRYLFETDDEDAAFKYIQFSDHAIASEDAHHFHIYFGNESQEALLEEMDHWPTYYPSNMTGLEIAQEMLAH